jgi:hypothetical protein
VGLVRSRSVDAGPADGSGRLERLVPLWRHAVWLVALFAILTMWVDIRVDVQQLRKDLDRSGRAHREARIQNDRLQLELDARRRSVVLEDAARQLSFGDDARLVRVVAPAPAAASALLESRTAAGSASLVPHRAPPDPSEGTQ